MLLVEQAVKYGTAQCMSTEARFLGETNKTKNELSLVSIIQSGEADVITLSIYDW